MIKFCYRYCSPHVPIDEKIEGRFGEHLQQTLDGGGGGAINLKKLHELLMFLIA